MIFKPKGGITFVLSPHIDDGELGCGGTIAKLISEQNEIHFFVFTLAKKSIPPEFPQDATEHELYNSMKALQIPKENLHVFDFEVRTFPNHRQEILEILVDLKKKLTPQLVFTPSIHDLHQDHEVIAKETLRAFKNSTILCYEEPWNLISFNFTTFSKLEKEHVERKIKVLKCYKTQAHRPYFQEEYFWSWARTRGARIGESYAEAFELMRLIF